MNTNLSEIIFILDRSGSMEGLESDTIGGYNSFLKKQREAPGDAQITTVLFDDQYELFHDGINIQRVKPITGNEYFTRGSTAMLDAIGKTIRAVGRRLSLTKTEERPGKVIFVITTDGMENSSREFSHEMIRNMIKHQREKYSWEFIFLGANIDAEAAAEEIGIPQKYAAGYRADELGTHNMFCTIANSVESIRECRELPDDWKDLLLDEQE